jgi:hypothetical protein
MYWVIYAVARYRRGRKVGVQLHGLLEILHRFGIPGSLEGLYSEIEIVAGGGTLGNCR